MAKRTYTRARDPHARTYSPLSQEEVVNRLLALRDKLGRTPTKLDLPPDLMSGVMRYFGRWVYAMEAVGFKKITKTRPDGKPKKTNSDRWYAQTVHKQLVENGSFHSDL